MVTKISVKEALQKKDAIFIDTRTPKEFAEDHLPNAINMPIFSNDERAIIGTIYKKISQDKAIEKGIELFSKRLPGFMEEINQYKDQELIIYCWRGGMRSKTAVALLDALKYNVKQLDGGHKKYRRYVIDSLENYQFKPKLIVLWGLTCTGKTNILEKFTNALDLEGLAQHRGSLYGGIGLTPNNQKRFESLFLHRLNELKNEKYIFVEGESKKIGNIQIPDFFYKIMKKSKHVLIKKSLEGRVKLAVAEYFSSPEAIVKIKEITASLNKVISKKHREQAVKFLDNQEYVKAAEILLEFYYDPLYNHTLKEIDFSFEITNNDVDETAKELKKIKK